MPRLQLFMEISVTIEIVLWVWSKFSPCSETCGYGGQTSRERTEAKKPCFVSCCNDDFNCNKAENKKCNSSSLKCNYENDCDDNQDEEDDACEEKCKWKYSDLKNDKKAIISINKTQKTSKLQYKFRCCKLNKEITTFNKGKKTAYTTGENVNDRFLQHGYDCDKDSYISKFRYKSKLVDGGFLRSKKFKIIMFENIVVDQCAKKLTLIGMKRIKKLTAWFVIKWIVERNSVVDGFWISSNWCLASIKIKINTNIHAVVSGTGKLNKSHKAGTKKNPVIYKSYYNNKKSLCVFTWFQDKLLFLIYYKHWRI